MKKFLLIFFLWIAIHCYGITLGPLTYNIYDYDRYGIGLAEVSASNTNISGNIEIPGAVSVNGIQFRVTRVAENGFQACQNLKSVSLPPTLESIGTKGFYLCTGLSKITFDKYHDNMEIGEYAFGQCSALTTIELPDHTTTIGKQAFSQCRNLTSVSFPNTLKEIKEYAFTGCNSLERVTVSSISDWCKVSIANFEASPFSHNDNSQIITDGSPVENLEIPASVTEIGNYVFAGNRQIKEVIFNKGLATIGEGAFQYASKISQITSNAEVPPVLGSYAFDGISTQIPVYVLDTALPNYQQSPGWSSFSNYVKIITETSERFTVDGVIYSTIGMGPNACAVIGSESDDIVIPGKVTFQNHIYYVKKIADGAFENSGLQSIKFDTGNLTEIGKRAFARTRITEISIPYGTEIIDDKAFDNCMLLETVTLPSNILKSIGDGAFNHCVNIRQITLPESLEYLGDEAFRECTNLSQINIPNALKTIREYTFMATGIKELILPESVATVRANAFLACDKLECIAFLSPNLFLDNGVFWWCTNLKDVGILAENLSSLTANTNPFNTSGIKIYVNKPLYETIISKNIWTNQDIIQRAIEFPDGKYRLIPGETLGFGYRRYDSSLLSDKIRFSSSNPSIFVYMDSYETNGAFNIPGNYIKGKNIGSATLIAESGYGLRGECPVTVYNIPTGIDIISSENIICVGDTVKLTALPYPENALVIPTWSSDNTAVAEIIEISADRSYAIIEGKGEGEANIYAKERDFQLSSAYKITVVPRAETLSLDPTIWSGEEGETFKITATVTPSNAISKPLEWSSSDELIATVDNGLVTILKEGNCIITARTTDGSDLSAECYISISSGVKEVVFDGEDTVDVYSLAGLLVKHECKRNQLDDLPSGVYFLRKGNKMEKLIIR